MIITVKGCRALLGSEKTLEEKSSGNYVQASKSPLPGVTQDALTPPAVSCKDQGSSLETQSPEFFSGTNHICTVCLPHTKIPDTEGNQVFGVKHIVGTI